MKNIWKYSDYLPVVEAKDRVILGEGDTPLVKSKRIAQVLGLKNLYFKLENLNPTGSYKDRFAAVFVSMLAAKGQKLCIATSSGNTGAALSAYCAAAGIKCILAIVDGAPLSKILQMQLYGAHVSMISGFGKDTRITNEVFASLKTMAQARNIPLPISAYAYCPEGMAGVETIAYEILDELKGEVDHIFVPAGGGGLTLAIAKGVVNYRNVKPGNTVKVNCVQPEGNNTIAGQLRLGKAIAIEVTTSSTQVSGLQVPNILDGNNVLGYCRDLAGNGYLVSDPNIFMWQRRLAQLEGIFCEPAGAVSLAGLANALAEGRIDRNDTVICLITGTGFKDMSSLDTRFQIDNYSKLESITELNRTLENL